MREELRSSQDPDAERIKQQIEELKQKIASRPQINEVDSQPFEVSREGTTSADFEIGK